MWAGLSRILCCGLALFCCAVRAQSAVAPEYALKVAYLYHFIQFTDWADSAVPTDKMLTVCALTGNPMLPALAILNNQPAHDKAIVVQALTENRYEHCQVLVLSGGEKKWLEKEKNNLVANHVLTVIDDPDEMPPTAMIAMGVEEQRVVFSINMTQVRAARLEISSKLLRLARAVQ